MVSASRTSPGPGGARMDDRGAVGATRALGGGFRARDLTVRLLLGSGPRFARDAVGPILLFYAGWKLIGLTAGIVGATTFALATFVWERRRARSGLAAALGLTLVLTQA